MTELPDRAALLPGKPNVDAGLRPSALVGPGTLLHIRQEYRESGLIVFSTNAAAEVRDVKPRGCDAIGEAGARFSRWSSETR